MKDNKSWVDSSKIATENWKQNALFDSCNPSPVLDCYRSNSDWPSGLRQTGSAWVVRSGDLGQRRGAVACQFFCVFHPTCRIFSFYGGPWDLFRGKKFCSFFRREEGEIEPKYLLKITLSKEWSQIEHSKGYLLIKKSEFLCLVVWQKLIFQNWSWDHWSSAVLFPRRRRVVWIRGEGRMLRLLRRGSPGHGAALWQSSAKEWRQGLPGRGNQGGEVQWKSVFK